MNQVMRIALITKKAVEQGKSNLLPALQCCIGQEVMEQQICSKKDRIL